MTEQGRIEHIGTDTFPLGLFFHIHCAEYVSSDKCDGGDILLRRIVFIHKDWDYHKLWEVIFPIGVEMVVEAVEKIENGSCEWEKQDEECATFEPSWNRPRLRRNDLIQLEG